MKVYLVIFQSLLLSGCFISSGFEFQPTERTRISESDDYYSEDGARVFEQAWIEGETLFIRNLNFAAPGPYRAYVVEDLVVISLEFTEFRDIFEPSAEPPPELLAIDLSAVPNQLRQLEKLCLANYVVWGLLSNSPKKISCLRLKGEIRD